MSTCISVANWVSPGSRQPIQSKMHLYSFILTFIALPVACFSCFFLHLYARDAGWLLCIFPWKQKRKRKIGLHKCFVPFATVFTEPQCAYLPLHSWLCFAIKHLVLLILRWFLNFQWLKSWICFPPPLCRMRLS